MIFDKETGILWDHNTRDRAENLQIRLTTNLQWLSRLHNLGIPEKIQVRKAHHYPQADEYSCEILAIHTLWMFHLDRDAVLRDHPTQGEGGSGEVWEDAAGYAIRA